MSGKEVQEEAVLAAAKTLKALELPGNSPDFTGREKASASYEAARPRAAAGLESLFEKHHDRVFRTAYRVTGNASDAEDVLQTVFLRIARGSDTVETAENAGAYFSRAAINASLDLIRGRKRSRAVAIDDVINSASVAGLVSQQNPESKQEDRELRRLVRDAVSKLGGTAAQMFALRYFEGYGNAEIATIMNTSPLVVGVTLHRARARMRKEIGRYLRSST